MAAWLAEADGADEGEAGSPEEPQKVIPLSDSDGARAPGLGAGSELDVKVLNEKTKGMLREHHS
jgi:hypothetical protein